MRQPRSKQTMNRMAASLRLHGDGGRFAIGIEYMDVSAIFDRLKSPRGRYLWPLDMGMRTRCTAALSITSPKMGITPESPREDVTSGA